MHSSKRKLSIRLALEWAFMTEYVGLDLGDHLVKDQVGIDTLYRLIERNRLGFVKIDGGGKSLPHDDAEIISASITKLSIISRNRGLALTVADCARFGKSVDWMEGAKPKIEPAEWKPMRGFSKGHMAKEEVLRRYTIATDRPHPRNPKKMVTYRSTREDSWCPCIWTTSLQEIETARDDYRKWVSALRWLRDDLKSHGNLETIELTQRLPATDPWAN